MKVGFVSMPVTGHLDPMTALACKLQSRGNEVVFIGLPDAEPIVRAANLNFVSFCEKEYPVGSVAKGYAPLAKLHGGALGQEKCIRAAVDRHWSLDWKSQQSQALRRGLSAQ